MTNRPRRGRPLQFATVALAEPGGLPVGFEADAVARYDHSRAAGDPVARVVSWHPMVPGGSSYRDRTLEIDGDVATIGKKVTDLFS